MCNSVNEFLYERIDPDVLLSTSNHRTTACPLSSGPFPPALKLALGRSFLQKPLSPVVHTVQSPHVLSRRPCSDTAYVRVA